MNHDLKRDGTVPFSQRWPCATRNAGHRFDILPIVRISNGHLFFRIILILSAIALLACLPFFASKAQSPQSAPAQQPGAPISTPPYPTSPPPQPQRTGLNVVVLDPAHGGTDPGARGAQGIRESDLVMDLTFQVRRALEAQGFQVLQTRSGNENPSFDDRSTPYVTLSRKFGDAVQGQLGQRFKGSPNNSQSATIRQLRTTAAPAIAVELASVSVQDRADLDRMMPGVGDAIARGVAEFRPSYVVPGAAGTHP